MGAGDPTGQKAVDIFVLSLGKADGESFLHGDRRVPLTVSIYHENLWNISEVFIIIMATSLIVAGAFFSTADMRKGSPIAQQSDEVVEMSTTEAWSLVFLMSVVLIMLFFFMK